MHGRLQSPIQYVLHSCSSSISISIKLKSLILNWFQCTDTIIIIVCSKVFGHRCRCYTWFVLLSDRYKSFQWISMAYSKFKTTTLMPFSSFILSTLHRLNFIFFNRFSFPFSSPMNTNTIEVFLLPIVRPNIEMSMFQN